MALVSSDLEMAKSILNSNGIIGLPTETVYGLAGNIYSETAIRKIFEVKERPLINPLIVHVDSIQKVKELVEFFPLKAQLLAESFWPGSLTLVLKKKKTIPDIITAGKDTVAIRIPKHPVTLKLLKELDFPLAAPSANPFNRISPTHAEHVANYFKSSIKMVLEGGECINGIESTIIGFDNEEPIVYRLGAIAIEDIEQVVGYVRIKNKVDKIPNAPGMLKKHYAPRTKVCLTNNIGVELARNKGKRIGLLTLDGFNGGSDVNHVEVLSQTRNLKEAASNLYTALHKLDALGLDLIVAQRMPDVCLGKSINDRLERASN